jgi:hypothetical protein
MKVVVCSRAWGYVDKPGKSPVFSIFTPDMGLFLYVGSVYAVVDMSRYPPAAVEKPG